MCVVAVVAAGDNSTDTEDVAFLGMMLGKRRCLIIMIPTTSAVLLEGHTVEKRNTLGSLHSSS